MEKKSPAFGNNKFFAVSVYLALCLGGAVNLVAAEPAPAGPVRKAAVAGGFYPGSKAELENFVDTLLRQAHPPEVSLPVYALMVPHAGYMYSGPIAAQAYKTVAGRDIRTVILLSNSHRTFFNGIAIYKSGSFETPLGSVPIDEVLANQLLEADPRILDRSDVHAGDHVIEVQLPFLQRMFKDFKIVPLLFGDENPVLSQILADVLEPFINDHTLIVASSDMSHYPPYADAMAADHLTLQAILTGHPESLGETFAKLALKKVPGAETYLCGASGVRTVMLLSQPLGQASPVLLGYSNSGDAPTGEKSRVVGYGAVAFVHAAQRPQEAPITADADQNEKTSEKNIVNSQEEKELLKLARLTVESYVHEKKIPSYSSSLPGLQQKLGAFVTLREHGQLRGCIGQFESSSPLYVIIQQMAVAAATQDPRFPPVRPEELGNLEYEISILSPLQKVKNADAIILGEHGVQISKGFRHGVFLPQVAAETGWTKEQFLGELCTQKAGLPADCWKDPNTNLYVFTAHVFAEKK